MNDPTLATSDEVLAAHSLSSAAYLGMPRAAELVVPGQPLSWGVYAMRLPAETGMEAASFIPHLREPGGIAVFQHGSQLNHRLALLLEPNAESFTTVEVAKGNFVGLALRPGNRQPALLRLDRDNISLRTLDGEDNVLARIPGSGITRAAFRHDGHYLVIRSKQGEFSGYLLSDKTTGIKCGLLEHKAHSRQPDAQNVFISYSPCGRKFYCFEDGEGSVCDLRQEGYPQSALPTMPNGSLPFLMDCRPDADPPAAIVVAGRGPFAQFMGENAAFWSTVRIAPDGEKIGATGMRWVIAGESHSSNVTPGICMGWRPDCLFLFAVPPLASNVDEAQQLRRAQTANSAPQYIASWHPPAGQRIISAQYCAGGKLIVYLAPLAQ